MIFLATQLDERTKKIILVLCALFIILLLISGTIYFFISKFMEKESRKMDTYMYPLIKNRIVKNPKEFISCLFYHETRFYFSEAKWGYRSLIIFTGVAFAVTFICFKGEYKDFFSKAFDIIPIINWQTIGDVNQALKESGVDTTLSGPSWLPASLFPEFISKNPDFTDPMLYCSVIYYSTVLFSMFFLSKATLAFLARFIRGTSLSKKVFNRDLDKIDLDAIDTYNEMLNMKNKDNNNREE